MGPISPIDYSINVESPFKAAVQGYQVGSAIREDQLKAEQMQAAQAQAQAQAMQLAQAREAAFQSPTAANFARLMTLDPKASEAYQRAWTTRSAEQQQSLASDLLQWGAAIKSGKPQIAADQLNARAAMIEQQNGGAPTQDSQAMRLQARLAVEQPEFALGQIQALLASNPLGKDAAETLGKFGTEARAAELQPSAIKEAGGKAREAVAKASTAETEAAFAERVQQAGLDEKSWQVRNLRSQISDRASRLKLDQARLENETLKVMSELQKNATDIGEAGKKLVNESATAAGVAKLTASKANDLSERITQIGSSWGYGSSFAEWLKKSTGEQGAVTQLRNEYARLRNTEALRNLPPGPATDKDIEVALQGIPPETADPATIQKFLRGMAKMADIDAAVNTAKADYLQSNRGSLSRAAAPFEAGGVAVPKGDDWTTVAARVAKKAASAYEPKPSAVDQIPTNAPGTPSPTPANSVRAQADAILAGGRR